MASRSNGREVIPYARRLIKSLRDMGYDFAAAVADLVDNSIEAGATVVMIDVEFNGDDSWVRISDNGLGMNSAQLKEAMRYGTEREYDSEMELGKFGLGLKTASLSQCQRLSVASRANPKSREINAFCWDLDHIDKTNRWEIVEPNRKELKLILGDNLSKATGTVVLWQRLDRILGYSHPYGEFARKRLLGMCRDLERHIAMVFHRFLAGEIPGKKLKIILNGNQIDPWDPFARDESKTRQLESVPIHLEHEGAAGIVTLEPYVLPHKDDFSSLEAFTRASGPANWNLQQGFYIYRANRLIQSGGWSRLRTSDEHTKLARVALSFSPHLDDAFKINVAKMRVQLPIQIREQVENAIKPVIKLALETYRKEGVKPPIVHPSPTLPTPSQPATPPVYIIGASQKGDVSDQLISPNGFPSPTTPSKPWTLDELQRDLEAIAKPNEKPVIKDVFERLRKKLNI